MNTFQVLRGYYSLFGGRGVWLGACSRWRRRSTEVAVVVPWLRYPVYVRLRSSDISTFRQVLVSAGYDSDDVRPPRTIVDAGANIGLASVFYAAKYPEARIISIEPEASNYVLLKRNTAPYPRITPVQGALWCASLELNIVDPGLGNWAFQTSSVVDPEAIRSRNHGTSRGLTVEMLMEEYGLDYIDLLKVDIEGAEKEVFENAAAWIGRVGAIAIELHDHLKPGCSHALEQVTRDFVRLGSRGETLFLARPQYRREGGEDANAALPGEDNCALEQPQKRPYRIIGYS